MTNLSGLWSCFTVTFKLLIQTSLINQFQLHLTEGWYHFIINQTQVKQRCEAGNKCVKVPHIYPLLQFSSHIKNIRVTSHRTIDAMKSWNCKSFTVYHISSCVTALTTRKAVMLTEQWKTSFTFHVH